MLLLFLNIVFVKCIWVELENICFVVVVGKFWYNLLILESLLLRIIIFGLSILINLVKLCVMWLISCV